ncbi:MAG: nucleotidyltransferase family protein [Magnetococcales bacterium]|nr:nucleotidyltransferase family protein [Magnetococcales bacterium]MBF0156351.1 nucleotidyltransferase family protein [Magnetococcales bacterium]
MDHWRTVLVGPEVPILEAIQVIDRGGLGVALVVDAADRLLGTVTDGDVRRGLLLHLQLDTPVQKVMNRQPTVAREEDTREHILSIMRTRDFDHIPVVDDLGRVVGLKTLRQLARPKRRDNWVVIMAGGLGSRLGPLTEDCPKPLLKVGSKPILETILESFIDHGFHRFFLSVNYKKRMIKEHFGDGNRWGVEIRYLEERERLGTAGSLALLPEVPREPFFVMNGDLLTRIHYPQILEFHQDHGAFATICVRRVEETVPYGVVELDRHQLIDIEEKPVRAYHVNAGIYLLDPVVLPLLPGNHERFDMTDLFRKVIARGWPTAAFPFLDYWLDIGRMPDFHRANLEYPEVFQ